MIQLLYSSNTELMSTTQVRKDDNVSKFMEYKHRSPPITDGQTKYYKPPVHILQVVPLPVNDKGILQQ